jgi:hypothetical protein
MSPIETLLQTQCIYHSTALPKLYMFCAPSFTRVKNFFINMKQFYCDVPSSALMLSMVITLMHCLWRTLDSSVCNMVVKGSAALTTRSPPRGLNEVLPSLLRDKASLQFKHQELQSYINSLACHHVKRDSEWDARTCRRVQDFRTQQVINYAKCLQTSNVNKPNISLQHLILLLGACILLHRTALLQHLDYEQE